MGLTLVGNHGARRGLTALRFSSQAGRTLPQGRAASAIPCHPDVNLTPLLGYHASVVEYWCRQQLALPCVGGARFAYSRPLLHGTSERRARYAVRTSPCGETSRAQPVNSRGVRIRGPVVENWCRQQMALPCVGGVRIAALARHPRETSQVRCANFASR